MREWEMIDTTVWLSLVQTAIPQGEKGIAH